jgi:hypothetical protein
MEILRLKFFEIENNLSHKNERLDFLGKIIFFKIIENEYTHVKTGIAGAMTALLEYGDAQVIEIMEYYLT